MSVHVNDANAYEDLLSEWSDLESGLSVILTNPTNTQEFAHRVVQYDRWMQGLLQRDPDVGLYLLFQLAGNSPVGYSASHSLVCAVLCHLVTSELNIAGKERDSLVRAALTMNVAMTSMQDALAGQAEKPTPDQQDAIRTHTIRGAMLLSRMGVLDDTWLDIVSSHHNDAVDAGALRDVPAASRLARILKMVDRYAAMISPRMSRAGRSATESARAILAQSSAKSDEIGHAMVRAVGLCPPGTYVRLDNDEVAVVVRRSTTANMPYVAIVSKSNGEPLGVPRLHATDHSAPRIRAALTASTVRMRLNHFQILQLGAYQVQHPA
jgi:hypothetical protein